jgi:hypothetical protein
MFVILRSSVSVFIGKDGENQEKTQDFQEFRFNNLRLILPQERFGAGIEGYAAKNSAKHHVRAPEECNQIVQFDCSVCVKCYRFKNIVI